MYPQSVQERVRGEGCSEDEWSPEREGSQGGGDTVHVQGKQVHPITYDVIIFIDVCVCVMHRFVLRLVELFENPKW